MASFDYTAFETVVTNTEGAQASAKVLIQEFVKYVSANIADPAVLRAYLDRLTASGDALAAAVAANPDPDPAD